MEVVVETGLKNFARGGMAKGELHHYADMAAQLRHNCDKLAKTVAIAGLGTGSSGGVGQFASGLWLHKHHTLWMCVPENGVGMAKTYSGNGHCDTVGGSSACMGYPLPNSALSARITANGSGSCTTQHNAETQECRRACCGRWCNRQGGLGCAEQCVLLLYLGRLGSFWQQLMLLGCQA